MLYFRAQLEGIIREAGERDTKTVGEHLYRMLSMFTHEVRNISRMSGDEYAAEVVFRTLGDVTSRTTRKELLARLAHLSERLAAYSAPIETGLAANAESSDSETATSTAAELANEKTIFVMMPFNSDFDDVWNGAIKRAAKDAGHKAIRVDMINKSTNITDDIVDSIKNCKLAIVDVTGNNPNVMFELGYAMALSKRHIIISQSAEFLPFDIRHIRTIVYNDSWSGIERLKEKLLEFLKGTMDGASASGTTAKRSTKRK